MSRLPGDLILGVAGRLLPPEQVDRVVVPAVADLRHEADRAPAGATRRAVVRRGQAAAMRALGWALLRAVGRPAGITIWVAALLACGAVLLGAAALGAWAPAQVIYLALGAVAFAVLARRPGAGDSPWPARAAWAGVALLAITVLAGVAQAGARRWLPVLGLTVRTPWLVTLLVAWGVATLAAQRRTRSALLLLGAGLALLAAAPDPVAALALAAAAAAAPLAAPRGRALAIALGLGATALALVRAPVLAPVPHAEGALHLVASLHPALAALGGTALVALCVLALRGATDPTSRSLAVGLAAFLGAGLAASLGGLEAVPLIGYGGSCVVAVLTGLGLVARGGRAPVQG